MTKSEYNKQEKRIKEYKDAMDKISVIENKIAKIRNGILSIKCAYDADIDFKYLGENFEERLILNIISFLKSEIEEIRKSIENI